MQGLPQHLSLVMQMPLLFLTSPWSYLCTFTLNKGAGKQDIKHLGKPAALQMPVTFTPSDIHTQGVDCCVCIPSPSIFQSPQTPSVGFLDTTGQRPLTDSIVNLSTKNWRAWRLKISCLSRHIRNDLDGRQGEKETKVSQDVSTGQEARATHDFTWSPVPSLAAFLHNGMAGQE